MLGCPHAQIWLVLALGLPDGEAESWFLRYFVPGQIALPDALYRSVTVYASCDGRIKSLGRWSAFRPNP